MYKVILMIIISIFFVSCSLADKGISNDEIIVETNKCLDANMCPIVALNFCGYPVRVTCVPWGNSERVTCVPCKK